MNLMKLTTGLSKMTGKTGLIISKHSPEIFLVLGIGSLLGAGVLACRATLKAHEVVEEHETKINAVKRAKDNHIDQPEIYSDEDYKRDLTVTYVQTAVAWTKLYGPAVSLAILGTVCILGSYRIMKGRNVALMAAYKAVEEAFSAYRKRVREEHGEETDYMYRHGLRYEKVTETEIGEDGKSKKVTKNKMVAIDPNAPSMYARYFDESASNWSNKDPSYNFMFLRAQQNYYNDLLQTRGHVFLNDIYDALGIPRSSAGAVVGWMIGEGRDSFIDFGIFEGENPRARDFVNGYEQSILLDFNVDGVIWDLLEGKQG